MGNVAEFKLAFFGLQPELQAEVRKHLRQNWVYQLELEKLFAIAQDAEVGLARRSGRRGGPGDGLDTACVGKCGAQRRQRYGEQRYPRTRTSEVRGADDPQASTLIRGVRVVIREV